VDEAVERLDLDCLDDDDPFEIDQQRAHLAKHSGLDDRVVYDIWENEPLFYPAVQPADWLMVADVGGRVLVVPIAKPDSGQPEKCRPIGCYEAGRRLADQYRADRLDVRRP
jgi:hypothetical protein